MNPHWGGFDFGQSTRPWSPTRFQFGSTPTRPPTVQGPLTHPLNMATGRPWFVLQPSPITQPTIASFPMPSVGIAGFTTVAQVQPSGIPMRTAAPQITRSNSEPRSFRFHPRVQNTIPVRINRSWKQAPMQGPVNRPQTRWRNPPRQVTTLIVPSTISQPVTGHQASSTETKDSSVSHVTSCTSGCPVIAYNNQKSLPNPAALYHTLPQPSEQSPDHDSSCRERPRGDAANQHVSLASNNQCDITAVTHERADETQINPLTMHGRAANAMLVSQLSSVRSMPRMGPPSSVPLASQCPPGTTLTSYLAHKQLQGVTAQLGLLQCSVGPAVTVSMLPPGTTSIPHAHRVESVVTAAHPVTVNSSPASMGNRPSVPVQGAQRSRNVQTEASHSQSTEEQPAEPAAKYTAPSDRPRSAPQGEDQHGVERKTTGDLNVSNEFHDCESEMASKQQDRVISHNRNLMLPHQTTDGSGLPRAETERIKLCSPSNDVPTGCGENLLTEVTSTVVDGSSSADGQGTDGCMDKRNAGASDGQDDRHSVPTSGTDARQPETSAHELSGNSVVDMLAKAPWQSSSSDTDSDFSAVLNNAPWLHMSGHDSSAEVPALHSSPLKDPMNTSIHILPQQSLATSLSNPSRGSPGPLLSSSPKVSAASVSGQDSPAKKTYSPFSSKSTLPPRSRMYHSPKPSTDPIMASSPLSLKLDDIIQDKLKKDRPQKSDPSSNEPEKLIASGSTSEANTDSLQKSAKLTNVKDKEKTSVQIRKLVLATEPVAPLGGAGDKVTSDMAAEADEDAMMSPRLVNFVGEEKTTDYKIPKLVPAEEPSGDAQPLPDIALPISPVIQRRKLQTASSPSSSPDKSPESAIISDDMMLRISQRLAESKKLAKYRSIHDEVCAVLKETKITHSSHDSTLACPSHDNEAALSNEGVAGGDFDDSYNPDKENMDLFASDSDDDLIDVPTGLTAPSKEKSPSPGPSSKRVRPSAGVQNNPSFVSATSISLDKLLAERHHKIANDEEIKTMQERLKEGLMQGGVTNYVESEEELLPQHVEELKRYNIKEKTIHDHHPGITVFNASRYLQLFSYPHNLTLANCGFVTANSAMDRQLLKLPPNVLLEFLTGDTILLSFNRISSPSEFLNWLFLLLSVHSNNLLQHSLMKTLYVLLLKEEGAATQWAPTLKLITSIFVNYGASVSDLCAAELPLPYTVEDLRLNEEDKENQGGVRAPPPPADESGFSQQNLRHVIQLLTTALTTRKALYDANDLTLLCVMVIKVALDSRLTLEVLKLDFQACISAIIQAFPDNCWQQKVQVLRQVLCSLTTHHHNLVYIVQLVPPTSRGVYLQRRLAFSILCHILQHPVTDTEDMSKPKVEHLFPVMVAIRSQLSDFYQVASFVLLLDYCIGNETLPSSERENLSQLTDELKAVMGDIKEYIHNLDRSTVKDMMARLRSKWSYMLQNMVAKQASMFDWAQSTTRSTIQIKEVQCKEENESQDLSQSLELSRNMNTDQSQEVTETDSEIPMDCGS